MARKKIIKKTKFEFIRPTLDDYSRVNEFMDSCSDGMLFVLAQNVPVAFYRMCFDVPTLEYEVEAIKRAHAIQHFYMSARRFFSVLSTERISSETLALDQRYNTLMIRSGDENWIDGQFGLFFPEFQQIKISTPINNKSYGNKTKKEKR